MAAAVSMVEQLARHEAGHAVATVALGFEVHSVWIEIREWTLAGQRVLVPSGLTVSNADPASGEVEDRNRCVIVALAGREARGQRFPGPAADKEWEHFEVSIFGARLRRSAHQRRHSTRLRLCSHLTPRLLEDCWRRRQPRRRWTAQQHC